MGKIALERWIASSEQSVVVASGSTAFAYHMKNTV